MLFVVLFRVFDVDVVYCLDCVDIRLFSSRLLFLVLCRLGVYVVLLCLGACLEVWLFWLLF